MSSAGAFPASGITTRRAACEKPIALCMPFLHFAMPPGFRGRDQGRAARASPAGQGFPPQQAERALSAFFTYENLSFLRELCLRGASGEQVRKIEAQELFRLATFGKSRLSPLRERLRGSFLLDFLYEAVGVDVHVANVTRSTPTSEIPHDSSYAAQAHPPFLFASGAAFRRARRPARRGHHQCGARASLSA